MGRFRRFALLLGAVCLAGLPAYADGVNFTDGTFNLSNYTQTTAFLSNPSATLTVAQCASCGNPGQGLQIIGTFPAPGITGAIGFVGNSFIYDPATQGAILSVDASADKDLSISPIASGTGNTFRPLIEQDGIDYLAAISGPVIGTGGTTGYNTLSQDGLLATNFLEYDFATGTSGTARPNFDGDTISFGLAQIFTSGGTVSLEADYDNLNIGVNSMPEPSSLALLTLGLAGLIGCAAISRRRTQLN